MKTFDKPEITDLNPSQRPTTTVQRKNIYEEVDEEKVELKFLMKDVESVKKGLPQENNSVDSIEVHYVVEYLTPIERINFVNDVHRVLKKGGKITIHTSHWAANKTYGNIAEIQWPPVAESWFPNLNKKHRKDNQITETRYTCDFEVTWGYGMHPLIVTRNMEYQQHALIFWKEAPQDLIVTLTKR